ncbi:MULTISPECIES: phenol hydroxylase subunit [unclassified Acinetobacter]|uniref:phenol hydroxylase subunit n=1 Tax=unclassified Acinetobacter TaxID=196816 RepID=UPI0029343F7D|nr:MULTISPECIES: phenol hydroxylase subunit [unclassified Acinetobacter]WOE30757.1 phenol hydroxylase subunit [Acinetobacter sp. SAAs470]WOE38950.1 phenol hydroxylase subunit [Acinetobacter sp. SAAs474]
MTLAPPPDQLIKYIRITGDRHAKFVEFDFAIHDPTLFVELVLPQAAFQHFCEINHVVEMTEAQQAWNDAQEDKWRYGLEPTLIHTPSTQLDQDDQH